MKQRRYRFVLTALAALMLLATGCSKEPQAGDFGDGTYLSLNIDGVKASTSAQSTRATAVNETAVNDLWVLQFQMTAGSTTEGTLVAKSYIDTVTDPAKVKFRPIEGNNMALYLVANSGNSSLFSSTANGATLAAVKATAVTVTSTTGNNFPTKTSANLPMVGQSATLKLPTTTALPVTLTRVAAKVVLTIKNPFVAVYPLLTITGTQLKNVPVAYSTQVITAAGTTYPTASVNNFKDYTATTGNITATGKTSTYYLAPNLRGMGTNTDPRLKSDLTAPSGQGSFCTYVEIMGTAKASASAPVVDVRYRLYLGANNTNDFNLYANTAYKVDIELTGINGNDARMLIATDKFDLIQGGIDNDYTGDAGGGWRPPFMIGDFRNGGIVYWVDPTDPEKYKVVSLEGRLRKWAASENYVVSGARSDTDGKKNSDAIKAAFDTKTAGVAITESTFDAAFPAAHHCYSYTGKDGTDPQGTWYLPAKNELQHLWCAYNGVAPTSWDSGGPADAMAQAVFNKYLTDAGGTSIPSIFFWSSTEYSGKTSNAWYVFFASGVTRIYDKDGDYHVRCVKHIVPPPVVGDFRDGGIVYEVTDATNYKVFSLDQGSNLQWAAENTYVLDAVGQNETDGKVNVAAMKKYSTDNISNADVGKKTTGVFATDFPAAGFCDSKNTGGVISWYLPARNELLTLCKVYKANKSVLDKAITDNGGTAITLDFFWSSTERSFDPSYACFVTFLSDYASYNGKSYGGYVRCVRAN